MEKHFVTYNQALALKELGYVDYSWFGSECSLYKPNGKHTFYMNGIGDNTYISAPLKSQVFRFFREKYNLFGCIDLHISTPIHWYIRIDDIIKNDYIYHSEDVNLKFNTYEEAESACIDKLIELVKGQ